MRHWLSPRWTWFRNNLLHDRQGWTIASTRQTSLFLSIGGAGIGLGAIARVNDCQTLAELTLHLGPLQAELSWWRWDDDDLNP